MRWLGPNGFMQKRFLSVPLIHTDKTDNTNCLESNIGIIGIIGLLF